MDALLQNSALILGIVNGLFLLRFYYRDRPRLRVTPVHPETYQWWFKLPDGEMAGAPTRRWGFLLYVGASNSGLRPTTLDEWRLEVRPKNLKRSRLTALSISEPEAWLGEMKKIYPVLGTRGLAHEGTTRLEPGGSIAGMVYYVYECYGDEEWDPKTESETIRVKLLVREVFGRRVRCKIDCRERNLDEIEEMVPGISTIDLSHRSHPSVTTD